MNHDFKHSAVPLQHGQFLPVSSQQTPRSSPVGARYRSSVVSLESDLSFATFIIVSYGMSCKIGPRYNGIRLYNQVYPVRVSETSNINLYTYIQVGYES